MYVFKKKPKKRRSQNYVNSILYFFVLICFLISFNKVSMPKNLLELTYQFLISYDNFVDILKTENQSQKEKNAALKK